MGTKEFRRSTILKIVEDYRNTRPILKTSQNQGLSTGTIRKILITAGTYSNDTSHRIMVIKRAYPDWTDRMIADALCVSQKTVELYSPYKGLDILNDDTDRAETTSDDITDSRRCGDEVFWDLSKNGRLAIRGQGSMWDYRGIRWGFTYYTRPKWW